LEREHHHLEKAIRTQYAAHIDDVVKQLKVEKLHLKERIVRLRDQIGEEDKS
jgi:hypothetical protein